MKLIEWVRQNKLASVLLILLLLTFFWNKSRVPLMSLNAPVMMDEYAAGERMSLPMGGKALDTSYEYSKVANTVPATGGQLIIQSSQLSLVVEDVRKVGDAIVAYAREKGGFMVSTSYNRPSESPFATITIRVSSKTLEQSMSYFRSLGVKVTNETLLGEDVTEQYTDIEARLSTVQKTKAKFEEILEKATEVQDILTVQQNIIAMQEQIDALVGQQKALEKNAELSRVTIYLSTDELALPYAPDRTFRPNLVFKEAVRSLLGSLTDLAESVIWLGVYSVIWAPILVVIIIFTKWRKRRARNVNTN